MQKIRSALPLLLFILIVLLWTFGREIKENSIFSYPQVNSINLQIDPHNTQAIFTKYQKGYGQGLFILNKGPSTDATIRLGGESSRDVFYETQKLEAATLHIDTKNAFSGKITPLYGDSSYSREHLAYMIYEDFFELAPENNFIKLSRNNEPEKLFLMVEDLSSHFFQRRKIQKLYTRSQGEEVRFLINQKAYNLLLEKFDHKFLLKYLLFAYLVDDQDGPFSGRGYTENATLIQDKFFHKYLLIPNDLDQTFQCIQNDLHDHIFELASYLLEHSKEKAALQRILIGIHRSVIEENLIEDLEKSIHEKLTNCCIDFLTQEYLVGRKDLLLKVECQKQRFNDFTKRLMTY